MPRVAGALGRLGALFADFTFPVLKDYSSRPGALLTDDALLVLERWLDEENENDLFSDREPLLNAAEHLAREAKIVIDSDREVLPADLVAVVDALAARLVQISRAREVLMGDDADEPAEIQRFIDRLAVRAVYQFAYVLREHADEVYFTVDYL